MFNEYIKKILPIPIVMIESNKDGYKYRITTYSSVISECGCENQIIKRISKNKRIKSISCWLNKPDNAYFSQAIIEFNKKAMN